MAHSLEAKERTNDVLLEDNVTFVEMLLPQNVLKGLDANGYKKPSPIQLKAIPVGRCGFDLVVKSKAGTGKTLVVTVIGLESINVAKQGPQVLVLAPTREIAMQICEVFCAVGQCIKDLKVACFIGGMPMDTDIQNCQSCHIAVGAPGRIKHLITSGHLLTSSIRLFVLDEADKLMDSTFKNDINTIYNSLPDRKQMITLSATYPNQLENFLSTYMLSPTHITAELQSPLLLGLKQFALAVKPCSAVALQMKTKNEILVKLLSSISFTQCLIFSNYQTRAESISNYLNQKGWQSMFISGAQSQEIRLEVISNLKTLKCRIIVSTDLTARGIDGANVDLVINYDVPIDAVTYLHRMGRAGRYGAKGNLITMAFNGNEIRQLQIILGKIGGSISIPMLENLEGNDIDLYNLDTVDLKTLQGTIQDGKADNSEIKSKIFELKEITSKSSKGKGNKINASNLQTQQEGETNDFSSEENSNKSTLLSFLNVTKTTINNSKYEAMDTTELLQSLASGSINPQTPQDDLTNNLSLKKNTSKSSKGDFLTFLNDSKTTTNDSKSVDTKQLLESLASGSCSSFQAPHEIQTYNLSSISNILNETKNSESKNTMITSQTVQSNKEFDTQAILKSSAESKMVVESRKNSAKTDHDHKKRKRIDNPKPSIIDKNRALLSISKVLDDNKKNLEIDDVSSVSTFLNILKTEVIESPETIISSKPDEPTEKPDPKAFENIFQYAYEYAINPNAKHWLELLPESEIKQKLERLDINDEDDDCEEDYYESDGHNEENQTSEEPDKRPKKIPKTVKDLEDDPDWSFMKWVPVKNSERIFTTKARKENLLQFQEGDCSEDYNPEDFCPENSYPEESYPEDSYHEDSCPQDSFTENHMDHYETTHSTTNGLQQQQPDGFCTYLDQCSTNLWNNGLNFHHSEDFEHWYENTWQSEVASVRNFIQRNIYVSEMSKYQRSCFNRCKK